MSDTLRYAMPLLDAAQAQKHVTVNEALTRADALASARAESRKKNAPPNHPSDGETHIVGPNPVDDWEEEAGQLAIFQNGGWEFVEPWSGCEMWVQDEGSRVTFDGQAWVSGHAAGSKRGAATLLRVLEFAYKLDSGPSTSTAPLIPDKALVLGVTGRVVQPITGADGWSLGVSDGPSRYGTGYGTEVDAFAHGVSGVPQAYYGGTSLLLTAEDGVFTGGEIVFAVHYIELVPPRPV